MGKVQVLSFFRKMGRLTIYLDKITNLKDKDFLCKSDPYVKFSLEQDNTFKRDKDYGNKKSSKKKNDLNPVYGETFTYSDLPGLKNLELTVKVMDDDKLSDDKLGKVKIKLEKLGLEHKGTIEDCWKIDSKLFSKRARIYLKLSWTENEYS